MFGCCAAQGLVVLQAGRMGRRRDSPPVLLAVSVHSLPHERLLQAAASAGLWHAGAGLRLARQMGLTWNASYASSDAWRSAGPARPIAAGASSISDGWRRSE